MKLRLWRGTVDSADHTVALPPQAPVHTPSLFYFTVKALATL